MTPTHAKTEVLKQDARGRVRVSGERREALLDEFERSGASGARFARLAGIKYATFANWVQKRRKQRMSVSTPAGVSDALAKTGPVRLFEHWSKVAGAPSSQSRVGTRCSSNCLAGVAYASSRRCIWRWRRSWWP